MRRLASTVALSLILALGGCAEVLQTLQQLARPSASVVDVRLTVLSFDGAVLEFDLRIENPMDVAIPLVNLDIALDAQGGRFLTGALPLQGTVPSHGQRTVTVPVDIDFVQTLRALSGLRPGQVIDYRAELGLGLDLPGVGPQRLPLAHNGQLPIPAIPKISLGSLKLSSLSWQQVEGVAVLELGNPNAFGVGLDRLDLGLQLAGRKVSDLRAPVGIEIDAGGSKTLEIPLSLRPLDLGAAVFDALRSGSASYGLEGGVDLSTPFGLLSSAVESSGEAPILRTR